MKRLILSLTVLIVLYASAAFPVDALTVVVVNNWQAGCRVDLLVGGEAAGAGQSFGGYVEPGQRASFRYQPLEDGPLNFQFEFTQERTVVSKATVVRREGVWDAQESGTGVSCPEEFGDIYTLTLIRE